MAADAGQLAAAAPAVTDCADTSQRGLAYPAVRRLSLAEIKAVLAEVYAPYGLGPAHEDLNAFPELPEMSDVQEHTADFSVGQLRAWSVFVDAMQQRYDQNSAVAIRFAGACAMQSPVADGCWSDLISQYGRALFRRPLADREREPLLGRVRGLTLRGGLPHVVGELLRAPDFLFHIELGTRTEGQHVRLSSHEVANRIAFATQGMAPDQPLREAAEQDALQTLEQVRSHTRRLVEDPKARTKLQGFFAEWFGFSHMKSPDYTYVNARLDLRGGATVKQLMTAELVEFAQHVIWREHGTFRDLLTRRIAFPRSELMQTVFGTDTFLAQDQHEPLEVQHHAGIAVRPGMMLNAAWETTPILRGAFVLNRLLCEEIPPPDFTQVAARFDSLGELDPVRLANFEITERLTEAEPCFTCHEKINPVGFIYEGFDPIGIPRTEQKVWKNFYELATTHPIPLPVNDVVIEDGLPTSFGSPLELADALAGSDKLRGCMSKYLFRHLQRRAETAADRCAIEETTELLRNDQPVLDMFVHAIANEDIFWRRAE
jgi:hypothetical protein